MTTETRHPSRLESFRGQPETVSRLRVALDAARLRGDAMPHVLLSGPPGLGKTTLAGIIAAEMGSTLRQTSGPLLRRVADLVGILADVEARDVVFLDEIHGLKRLVEEALYPAMQDFALDVDVRETFPNVASLMPAGSSPLKRVTLPPFTVVGATTRQGDLSAPLLDRFGLVETLQLYSPEILAEIVTKSAEIPIPPDAALELGTRGRGTPRIVLRLLDRATDYAIVHNADTVDLGAARAALDLAGIDSLGLDVLDRAILAMLAEIGHPVGVRTVAARIGETTETVEEREPYLLRAGLILRTPRGRAISARGKRHIEERTE